MELMGFNLGEEETHLTFNERKINQKRLFPFSTVSCASAHCIQIET